LRNHLQVLAVGQTLVTKHIVNLSVNSRQQDWVVFPVEPDPVVSRSW